MNNIHILFTRPEEPETCAVLTLRATRPSADAFHVFRKALHAYFTNTKEGMEINGENDGDFNVGDFLLHDATITNDPVFRAVMESLGVEYVGIDCSELHLLYDMCLADAPEPPKDFAP